jgi:4-amino-4-deoxy-L-arabinose transferase-like glycosyltransferase
MAASGDWLIPHIGGVVYADKPPLFFWFVAALFRATGSIKVAMLLPAFAAGLAILWLVYDLARRLWNQETAWWAGATLLAILQFPLQMKSGQIDGFLCLWTTLGLYALCRHLLLGPNWGWYGAAGLFCALGILAKGVGFLPFLILIPYAYAALRDWPLPEMRGSLARWALAPFALALVIGVWLVAITLATSASADPALAHYRDELLFRQTVTRYGHAWGHLKPPWYFLTNAVPFLWFPVTALLPWLIPGWIRELKDRNPATLLLGGWVVLVLVFFSMSAGKRSVYILPAVPALALLSAPQLPRLIARIGVQRLLFGLGMLMTALAVAAGAYALAHPALLVRWFDQPATVTRLAWIVIGLGLLAMMGVLLLGVRRAPLGLAAALCVMWVALPCFAFPVVDSARSGKSIVDAAALRMHDGELLGLAGWKEQFLLQWQRPAVHFGFRRQDKQQESADAARWLTEADGRRLLLPEAMIRPCFKRSMLVDLGLAHDERWFLATSSAVTGACRASQIGSIR